MLAWRGAAAFNQTVRLHTALHRRGNNCVDSEWSSERKLRIEWKCPNPFTSHWWSNTFGMNSPRSEAGSCEAFIVDPRRIKHSGTRRCRQTWEMKNQALIVIVTQFVCPSYTNYEIMTSLFRVVHWLGSCRFVTFEIWVSRKKFGKHCSGDCW